MKYTLIMFSAAVFILGCGYVTAQDSEKTVRVKEISVVNTNNTYDAWPTLTKTSNDELLVVYSGGRDGHICPFGRVEMIRSKDYGKTWSSPEILIDSPLDDRDAGILETDKGTLLATWFTSTAWQKYFNLAVNDPNKIKEYGWDDKTFDRWEKADKNMLSKNCPYPEMQKYMQRTEHGDKSLPYPQWLIRSEDKGKSWSQPYQAPLMAPNGPILTQDNRLLWAGKKEPPLTGEKKAVIAVAESFDDGKSWEIIGHIPAMEGHNPNLYHELHIIDCSTSHLVAQIRNHNDTYNNEILQTDSFDGGKTWSVPRSIGLWGFPTHLLKTPDGRLLMTYSYRGSMRKPADKNRIYVCVSDDCGQTWSQPKLIADDIAHVDFGYPTTTILPNGNYITIWYQYFPENGFSHYTFGRKVHLVKAIWTLER